MGTLGVSWSIHGVLAPWTALVENRRPRSIGHGLAAYPSIAQRFGYRLRRSSTMAVIAAMTSAVMAWSASTSFA